MGSYSAVANCFRILFIILNLFFVVSYVALYLWLALYILAVRYAIRLQLHYIVVAIDGNFCQEYL